MSFVFWQNVPSIHQAPWLRELALVAEEEVLVVTEGDVPDSRVAQGWEQPDFSPAILVVNPEPRARAELITQTARPGFVHVFSGLSAYAETYRTFRRVSATPATVGVFLERVRDDDGWKAIIRRCAYRFQAIRWRRRLDFMLVTGNAGIEWYARVGFSRCSMYPFGYSVGCNASTEESEARRAEGTPFQLLFVGAVEPWKGVVGLIEALASLGEEDWELTVIGTGSLETRARETAERMSVAGRIVWRGSLSNSQVRLEMVRADALVLPSLYDGWGAVVNEALVAGTRVIVSDRCGAADMVRAALIGRVFVADSRDSLRRAIRDALNSGRYSAEQRHRLRQWALNSICPGAAAEYFCAIVKNVLGQGPRPIPPWVRNTVR